MIGHAQNPADKYFECASSLFDSLLDRDDIFVVVDDGGLVWKEWDSELNDLSLPAAVLAELLKAGRVLEVSLTALHADDKKFVETQIRRSKPRDRTFLKVAMIHSEELISNDYTDFTVAVRRAVKKRCGLLLLDACEVVEAWA